MGYSQRAAILQVGVNHLNVYNRCLMFKAVSDGHSWIYTYDLNFTGTFCGQISNPVLFRKFYDGFKVKIKKFKSIKHKYGLTILIQVPFSMSKDEEFFVDNIYRVGQQKLFDRLTNKAEKALSKFNEESALLCASGIAEYVNLYK